MNWIEIKEVSDIDFVLEKSVVSPVLIFKHSTRCIVSRTVLKHFERDFNSESGILPFFIDLLNYRAVSNEVASFFNVVHQSPQVLVIKNKVCVYACSHDAIVFDVIKDKI